VLRWLGVYQEMMPEAQSVEAFPTWWDTCADRLMQGFRDAGARPPCG